MKEKEIVFHFSNFLIFTQNHLLTIRNTPHTQNSTKRFYSVYRRPSKEKARKEKKKKNRESRGTGLGPIGPHGDLRLFLVSLFGGRTAP